MLIDTNVLIYDTFKDSLYHSEAKNILDSLEKWTIPTIVVHEYVWVLKSLRIPVNNVLYKVMEYIQHYKADLAYVTEKNIISALNFIAKEGISLSRYNDKIILSIALERGKRMATFDKNLRKQATALGVNVIPENL